MMQRKSFAESNPSQTNAQWLQCSHLVKYSNGGCSGFEPDSLLHLLSVQLFKPYLLISYLIKDIIAYVGVVCKMEKQTFLFVQNQLTLQLYIACKVCRRFHGSFQPQLCPTQQDNSYNGEWLHPSSHLCINIISRSYIHYTKIDANKNMKKQDR